MIVTIESDIRNSKRINYPAEKYTTTRVELTNKLPKDHDVVSIRLETIPHNLRKVHLMLGYNRVGTIHTFLPGQNLLEQVMYDPQEMLPLSKSRCMRTHIDFCYENDLSESTDPSTYYYQEEKNSKRVLSEDIVEFYDIDEDEFRKGKQVLRYDTEITKHLCFKSPQIVIETKLNECEQSENEKLYKVKVWNIHTFYKDTYSESEIMRYINDYGLHLENGKDVIEEFRSLEKGENLVGKMVYYIDFSRGFVNTAYHY
jgi:hypothetical protein